MKILHCCLANFFVDGSSYQENILTKMHCLNGHEVEVLASTETFVDRTELGYVKAGSYINEDNIRVTRIPYVQWLPHRIAIKVRAYVGVETYLNQFQPDIIFVHGPQFYDVRKIVNYAQKNSKVRIYADSHTDFINSGRNWFSKNIQHRFLYKYYVQQLVPVAEKIFGVLPLRVAFLEEVYKVPQSKTELLLMGIDDSILKNKNKAKIKSQIRAELGLKEADILILSGGKIRPSKKIVELLQAVNNLKQTNIKVGIVGVPLESFRSKYIEETEGLEFFDFGWQSSESMYDYLMAADLAFFPGTHSVLWEQAVGVGLPCVFKRIEGITHLDIGGNCRFIDDVTVEGITNELKSIFTLPGKFAKMKLAANSVKHEDFYYSKIAEQAIGNN